MWKRKVGDSVVIGDDTVVSVAGVRLAGGGVFKGEVTLGFEAPEGALVQRAETYLKQNETPPFPQFYRYCERKSGRVVGYALSPPAEISTREDDYLFELIAGYEDLTDDDRQVVIYLFRTDAEAEAFVIGLNAAEVVGVEIGVVKERRGNLWAVMLDFYSRYPDEDPNPLIRSFANPSPRVMAAIENTPRRRAG
jgi:sRNA-binding carbon storage regulator CsrA